MIVYLIYYILFGLLTFIEDKVKNLPSKKILVKIITVFSFILLVFLIGMRWRTGTDWDPYYYFFYWSFSRGFFEPDSYMDYGYVLFNNFCYFINDNYSFLLILHAFIFYFCLYKFYALFTKNVIFAVFLYTVMFFGMVGSNRQLLAVSCTCLALYFYLKPNYKVAVLFFLISVSFHITAVLSLLFIFFNRKYDVKYILLFFIIAYFIGNSGIIENLFALVGTTGDTNEGKVEAYKDATGAGTELSIIGIIRRVTMVVLLIYYSSVLRKKFKYFDLCLNSYLYTVAGFLIFGSIPILAGRGMLYFTIFEPILLMYLLIMLSKFTIKPLKYLLIGVIVILFFFQSINLYPELFIPYQGIFINTIHFRYMN